MKLPQGRRRSLQNRLGAERIVSVGHFALLSVRVLIWLDLLRPDSFPGAVTNAMDLRNGNHPILRVKKSAVRRPHFQVCCLACFTCLFLRDVTCNRF